MVVNDEWEEVTREELRDGDVVRITYVGVVVGQGVCVDGTVGEIRPSSAILRRPVDKVLTRPSTVDIMET